MRPVPGWSQPRQPSPPASPGGFVPTLKTIESGVSLETQYYHEDDSDSAEASDCREVINDLLADVTKSESTPSSVATSTCQFAEPTQSLVFLDWDDTVFATSDLFDRWNLPKRSVVPTPITGLHPELERDLAKWRTAAAEYLSVACALSDRCVVVTNSSPQWVETCIGRFAPEMRSLFASPNGPRVVYAGQALRAQERAARGDGCCLPGRFWAGPKADGCMRRWCDTMREALSPPRGSEERASEFTRAKMAAMSQEAKAFYSQYPGQTWKNIVSLGDMRYERDAVQELSASRMHAQAAALGIGGIPRRRERLRTKAIILPGAPTLSEITLWLRLFKVLLPALVAFDGDVDLDLHNCVQPLQQLSRTLGLPKLSTISLPQLRPSWTGTVSLPEGPGFYRTLCDLRVDSEVDSDSKAVGEFEAGTLVDIVQIVGVAIDSGGEKGTVANSDQGPTLRGRVTGRAPRWITLVSRGNPLVDREDDAQQDEALAEVAVAVQESLAHRARSASVGSRSPLSTPGCSPPMRPQVPGNSVRWSIGEELQI